MTAPQAPSDDLIQIIEQIVEDKLAEVHTSQPGKVVDYDPAEGTATIQLALGRRLPDGTLEPPPQLFNVPVHQWSSGNTLLTLPVPAGTWVYVVFSELPTLHWRENGTATDPQFDERHGPNGPVALLLGYPDTDKPAHDNTVIKLGFKDGDGQIVIKDDGLVEVTGGSQFVARADKVDAELDRLWAAVEAHIHPGGTISGNTGPASAVAAPTVVDGWASTATNAESSDGTAADKLKTD